MWRLVFIRLHIWAMSLCCCEKNGDVVFCIQSLPKLVIVSDTSNLMLVTPIMVRVRVSVPVNDKCKILWSIKSLFFSLCNSFMSRSTFSQLSKMNKSSQIFHLQYLFREKKCSAVQRTTFWTSITVVNRQYLLGAKWDWEKNREIYNHRKGTKWKSSNSTQTE